MTLYLRHKLIESILHKQLSWFDREDRAPGILTNIIASDILSLNGMTTETLVVLFGLVVTTCLGVGFGFLICWQATVLSILLSPIMIGGIYALNTI